MSYQVLARKWRPKNFDELVGQTATVQALKNALASQKLHHAYLLTGTRGVGKTTLARILAKSFNCEKGISANPCCTCQTCLQIDEGRFIDLFEIDAASHTGVDNIRDILEDTQYTPSMGRFKVYLIDEAHMLSKSAFNAMLKTLEEPPSHIKFILATTDPNKLPITILSRCLTFSLNNMTILEMTQHLMRILKNENIAFEDNAIAYLARAAEGSMRDALSLLDQAIAYTPEKVSEKSITEMLGAADNSALLTLLNHLANNQRTELLQYAQKLISQGISASIALSDLAQLLHQIALLQLTHQASIHEESLQKSLLDLSQRISADNLQLYYQIVVAGKRDLILAPDESSGFLMTIIRLSAFQLVEPQKPTSLAEEKESAYSPHAKAMSWSTKKSSISARTEDCLKKTTLAIVEENKKEQAKARETLKKAPLAQLLKSEFEATLCTETIRPSDHSL